MSIYLKMLSIFSFYMPKCGISQSRICISDLSMRPARSRSCRQARRQINLSAFLIVQATKQILPKITQAKVFFPEDSKEPCP